MRHFLVAELGVTFANGGALSTPVNSASVVCASIEMAVCIA
jgi:hypothetical protein